MQIYRDTVDMQFLGLLGCLFGRNWGVTANGFRVSLCVRKQSKINDNNGT